MQIRDIAQNNLKVEFNMYIPEIPNNSLTEKIEQIKGLALTLHERRRFVFNQAASKSEILEWEQINNVTLPESYADWLEFSNGSVLRGTLAEIYGLSSIVTKSEYYPDDYVVIGSLVGDGEILCFSKETGGLFTDDHGDITDYDDFNEVLEEIIEDIKGMW